MASSPGQDAHGGRATQKKSESLTDAVADPVSETNVKTSPDGPARRISAENTDASVADSTEDSPLLSGDEDSNAESGGARTRVAAGPGQEVDTSQETKGLWYILALTISIAGLQMAWAVELSNGSPYLLSLGLSKSLMALVWMAGPLTGTLVVPYVGIVSDNCRSRWGKRRPFMVGGTVATVVGLLFLGWTRELVGGILGFFGADPESQGVRIVIVVAAVVGIYVLDIAINTVQAAIRALIVDCAPAHQQEEANAMASRVTGFGNILGYLAGFVKLHTYLWFLGDNQFKILCALASIGLAATVALSAVFVHERNPQLDGSLAKKTPSILSFFFNILHSIKRLPPQTKRVCQVQFFAWVGFFPLLFYTSSYIGEIYAQPFLEKNPNMKPDELDALYEKATRIGTFALLVNSIVSLVTNVFLPFFIAPTFDNTPPVPVSAAATAANGQQTSTTSASVARTKQSPLDFLRIPGFTLRRAWLGSLFLFAGSMFCTVLVRSVSAATVLIALAGITWAMTLWAPWAIISAEISHRDVVARAARLKNMAPRQILLHDADASSPSSSSPSSSSSSSHHGLQEQQEEQQQQQQQQEEPDLERNPAQEPHDQAGVILGIHNMAIAVPQMIATLGSSLVFKLIQKPRGTPGDHSFATVMALGGISVLVACLFALKIDDGACKREGGGGGYREEDDGEGLGRGLLSGRE
ncbi:hypothetical protein E4U40_000365 [Claviceps sp. LM458 group G5]|nr:hypothetical protein E4U40_000365 [Claviceps sp. LM458 group G5]